MLEIKPKLERKENKTGLSQNLASNTSLETLLCFLKNLRKFISSAKNKALQATL